RLLEPHPQPPLECLPRTASCPLPPGVFLAETIIPAQTPCAMASKQPPTSHLPAAYFITFTTYGARLHGDERGSVERLRHGGGFRPVAPDFVRETREWGNLVGGPFTLEKKSRETVAEVVSEVAAHKGWYLHVVNVRTNHVHVVISGEARPELMLNAFKSWSTRRLREAGLVGATARVWTRHGSTRYLWSEEDVEEACTYVFEGQGTNLGGVRM